MGFLIREANSHLGIVLFLLYTFFLHFFASHFYIKELPPVPLPLTINTLRKVKIQIGGPECRRNIFAVIFYFEASKRKQYFHYGMPKYCYVKNNSFLAIQFSREEFYIEDFHQENNYRGMNKVKGNQQRVAEPRNHWWFKNNCHNLKYTTVLCPT